MRRANAERYSGLTPLLARVRPITPSEIALTLVRGLVGSDEDAPWMYLAPFHADCLHRRGARMNGAASLIRRDGNQATDQLSWLLTSKSVHGPFPRVSLSDKNNKKKKRKMYSQGKCMQAERRKKQLK